ncbi:protein kinase [Longispora sp. NPDC051575]|uniref:protein kinase domain-containing protein n=1 Tax=Longispora sp. NPDC051575 TaxID=3154943 RepID=UPI00343F503E
MRGIADYTFVRPLGSGNHGHYHLALTPARLPVDAEHVAVKVLAGESTTATFRRATRELTAFAAVRSPYLVAPYDAGQQDGIFYYATEYLDGGTLADPVAPADAPRAVAHAARAAGALHRAGIVHRDIKPANVLLHAGGAKLSDLGLSHVFTAGVTLTGMGSMASAEYTDPAVLGGEPPRPASDVYSLGVVLHRAVAGVGLYGELPADDGLFVLRRILSTEPVVSPALPGAVAALVRACLGPVDGRPDAEALADRIDALS